MYPEWPYYEFEGLRIDPEVKREEIRLVEREEWETVYEEDGYQLQAIGAAIKAGATAVPGATSLLLRWTDPESPIVFGLWYSMNMTSLEHYVDWEKLEAFAIRHFVK